MPRLFSEMARERVSEGEGKGSAPEGDSGVAARDVQESGGMSAGDAETEEETVSNPPALAGRRTGTPLRKARVEGVRVEAAGTVLSGEQRMLILDAWSRSQLRASEFGKLVGVERHTLYAWKRRFEEWGPAGLDERKRGVSTGSRMPEATRRAVLMMKQSHPEWGCDRLRDMLMRSAGFGASSAAIARVLREAGYETAEEATHRHPDKPRRFERARPNQLWQSDLFTFLLKRDNRRLYLIAFLDDHSRFVVGYGLYASCSGALVREVFEAAIANFGPPEEVLTDQGPQYHTWRGKSEFHRLCERRGIRQVVARARHPQTLGKIERFWGTLWRECVEAAVFTSLEEARQRVGWFIDHYNFQRTHQSLEGLVPADRYFSAAPEVLGTLKSRVEGNALDLARHGTPRQSFYLTGRVGEEGITLHGEGGKIVLRKEDGTREEVDLTAAGRRAEPGERAAISERTLQTHPLEGVGGEIEKASEGEGS
ncbi:MAG: IS481 family transposase [Acidobacteria bacterium]|nr:IS481 family transposase [Acidobacteriota bacterium]